jgi:hypothetical protein
MPRTQDAGRAIALTRDTHHKDTNMKGVWDGLDKERIAKAVVTAYMSDEYLDILADINNAETPAQAETAKGRIKEVMGLWREECPDYAFMVDGLFLFAERRIRDLTGLS